MALHYGRRQPVARAARLAPRTDTHPTFTRGPQVLQRTLLGVPAKPWDSPLPGLQGSPSEPERAIFWAHLRLGLVPDVDFVAQSGFAGGHRQLGGVVPDFLERDIPVAINVQGVYVHYRRGTATIMRDLATRQVLARYGLQLILIDEALALGDPIGALKDARNGIDRSYATRNY